MMNTSFVKRHIGSLLFGLLLFSGLTVSARDFEHTKKKDVSKSFAVSQNDLLQVDNRYGNITITHWTKNEVSIVVRIESSAERESRAQENLDCIQIDLKKEGNVVSAITTLKNQNNNGGGNQRFTINYDISMPSKLTVDLSQKYGNINMPDNNPGKCSLHSKYGNLNAGNFTASLELESKYGNVELGNVEDARMDLGYVGNLKMKDGKNLTIDSKYSNLTMRNVHKLQLEKKYGNLVIGHIDRANLEVKYSDVSIDELTQELEVGSLSYSTLKIKELSPNFNRVNVEAHYGHLILNISSKASFSVMAESMKYGDYDIDGFNITRSEKEEKVNFKSEINGGGPHKIYFGGNSYGNLKIKAL